MHGNTKHSTVGLSWVHSVLGWIIELGCEKKKRWGEKVEPTAPFIWDADRRDCVMHVPGTANARYLILIGAQNEHVANH